MRALAASVAGRVGPVAREARWDGVASRDDRLDLVVPLSVGQKPPPQPERRAIGEVRRLLDVVVTGVVCLPHIK